MSSTSGPGCGGTLDIQLEKDAVLPLSMVREFNIEGQKEVPGSYNRRFGLWPCEQHVVPEPLLSGGN